MYTESLHLSKTVPTDHLLCLTAESPDDYNVFFNSGRIVPTVGGGTVSCWWVGWVGVGGFGWMDGLDDIGWDLIRSYFIC